MPETTNFVSDTTDIPISSSSSSSSSSSTTTKTRSLRSPEKPSPTLSHLCLSSLRPHPFHVATLFVSATSDLLYSASSHHISSWALPSLSPISSFNDSASASGSVKSLLFSDGKLFTAHQDCKIRVWELTPSRRHRLLASLPTVADRLRRCLFPGNYVRVRRHRKRLWIEHADAVSALSARNGLLYSASWDRTLKIWRAADLRCLESIAAAHDDAINAVAVSADGTVYTGSADRRIRVWGKGSGARRHSLIATLERHRSAVNALALSEDGSILFSGAKDRSIVAWEKMAVIGEMVGHGGPILCLISAGDLLFSGSADRTVRIWRRGEEGKGFGCVGVLEGHEGAVKSLGAVWDGKLGAFVVCSGSLDGEIRVWKIWGPLINRTDGDRCRDHDRDHLNGGI